MANRYWIGGTGSWSDTAHWSTSTGGTGGASVPTSSDNVYFDANSFTTTGQIVTINANTNCLDMDWTGALYNPTLSHTSASYSQYIGGSLTLISGMTMSGTYAGNIYFNGSSTGKTITTAGKTCRLMYFSGSGGWTLQDDVTLGGGGVIHTTGVLNTNSKNITCGGSFSSNGSSTRTLTLGSSIITVSGDVNFTSNGLTLSTGTSTFILTGASKTFSGASLSFYNLEFQNTPQLIDGSNTFNQLKLTAGKTVKFTSGTTQIISELIALGTLGNLITLQSVTSGTPTTISNSKYQCNVKYCSIQDITATGGAVFNAVKSTNVSGNTGWTFVDSVVTGHLAPVTSSVSGFMIPSDKTKLDGIETGATADMTASEILTAIKTVDGTGSGLDADMLEGQHGSAYILASNGITGGTPSSF